ncbi:MAG: hypothetical protein CMM58_04545 [Rhodospirillaceae bacterium]|nr:hypothetical protein [Rhodospirillaceae bacterium]|tara:strand:+ start:5557 stop:6273 length:717 start_codon:yes stop_codon:yes gene_type:complete
MDKKEFILQTFDTRFFGFPVYKFEPKSISEIQGLTRFIPADAGLVSMRVPIEWSYATTSTVFREIERLVVLERQLRPDEHRELRNNVRICSIADAHACEALAKRCFKHDRYHKDPFIDNNIANATKGQWAFNNVVSRGDCGFVIDIENRVVGFNLCRRENDKALIDLIAVDPQIQGKGYGQALVCAALQHYARECKVIQVGTQRDNHSSLAIYEKTGFHKVQEYVTYHWTLNQWDNRK